MKREAIGLAVLMTMAATGCSATTTPGYIGYTALKDGKGERTILFGFDANRRGQLARLTSSGELIDSCSEPPPDAATTLAQKASAEAGADIKTAAEATGSGRISGSYEASQAVVELGKRTSETLFLREILFRRCEARMNARIVSREQAALVTGGAVAQNGAAATFTAAEIKEIHDAQNKQAGTDDKFFEEVIKAYSGLAASRERAEQVTLLREMQQKLSAEDWKDSELLKRVAAAVSDPTKVASVYERAAELAKQREDAKRKKAEDEARPKCEEKQKAPLKECRDACKGTPKEIQECKAECESVASGIVKKCVDDTIAVAK